MYSIYIDDVCIFDDHSSNDALKLINPKLVMEDNAAGSLDFTLPLTNQGYNAASCLTSRVIVYKDGEELWSGRPVMESSDFFNRKRITCEGELAYLNDILLPTWYMPSESKILVGDYLENVLDYYNARVQEYKRFQPGIVSQSLASKSFYYDYYDYESIFSRLADELLYMFGGHFRIRLSEGVKYLDYLDDYPNTNSQNVSYGINLLDVTKSYDLTETEFATVLIPLGSRRDGEYRLTVESVNGGSVYIESIDALDMYGRIEKTMIRDDITDATDLLNAGRDYLNRVQFSELQLTVQAMDLNYLNSFSSYHRRAYEQIKLLDKVRVISEPHGLNALFPVTKLTIPLDSPENASYELGKKFYRKLTDNYVRRNS